MTQAIPQKSLHEVRQAIDDIDKQLIDLLA